MWADVRVLTLATKGRVRVMVLAAVGIVPGTGSSCVSLGDHQQTKANESSNVRLCQQSMQFGLKEQMRLVSALYDCNQA